VLASVSAVSWVAGSSGWYPVRGYAGAHGWNITIAPVLRVRGLKRAPGMAGGFVASNHTLLGPEDTAAALLVFGRVGPVVVSQSYAHVRPFAGFGGGSGSPGLLAVSIPCRIARDRVGVLL
jgi:hypothetical protein